MIDLTKRQTQPPRPPRIVLYGEPKVGKSSFAASCPDVFFIDTEEGHDYLRREMGDKYNGTQVTSFAAQREGEHSFVEVLSALAKQDHPYKAVCIDTVDWLERMIHDDICLKYNAASITDKKNERTSYGQGYIAAANVFRDICLRLDRLRAVKGMAIILIAHSVCKRVEEPDVEGYDRFVMKLHEKSEAVIREWADMLLFARLETRKLATGQNVQGERVLITGGTRSAVVGSRAKLPERLPLNWQDFFNAYNGKTEGN